VWRAGGDARRAIGAGSGREAIRAAWRGERARPGPRRHWLRRLLAALLATGGVAGRGSWRWLRGRWRRWRDRDDGELDEDGAVADTVVDPLAGEDGELAEPDVVPGTPPPHPDDVAPTRPEPRPAMARTTGGSGMFAPATLIEDALAKAATYDPEDMWQFIEHLDVLPEMAANFAKIFSVLAEKAQAELPAAHQVAGLLDDIARVGRAVASAAEEAGPGARRAHEADLARRDAPRGDERKWNV
jgi:hypothetical protein